MAVKVTPLVVKETLNVKVDPVYGTFVEFGFSIAKVANLGA